MTEHGAEDHAWVAGARAAADRLRLCLAPGAHGGVASGLLGRGAGSSIEYQDHRPFLLGDDPRGLDWRAYARTGQYTLKVYREEVVPHIDLVLDVSPSMSLYTQKRQRVLEILCFCVESAHRARATLRCYSSTRAHVEPLDPAHVLADAWPQTARRNADPGDASRAPDLRRIPWRPRALRVWISDLLFADEPRVVLSGLTAAAGRAIVLVPQCRAESDPAWSGTLEMVDVEGSGTRLRRLDAPLLARYRRAFAAHFGALFEQGRARGIRMARVRSDRSLLDALCEEGLRAQVVELWG